MGFNPFNICQEGDKNVCQGREQPCTLISLIRHLSPLSDPTSAHTLMDCFLPVKRASAGNTDTYDETTQLLQTGKR
jgi:hypothetical protein